MGSEWRESSVGALVQDGAATIQTGPFGSQLHKSDYSQAGVSIIPTEAIGRGRIREIELPMVSQEKAEELGRHKLHSGDIVFARRGIQATGLSAVVEDRHAGALCGTGAILLRVDPSVVNPWFLAAYLASDEVYEWLRAQAVGAVMPNLNSSIIKSLPLSLPSMPVQNEIAGISNSLISKISLLRETNTTLEAIAQALFKSWFVDFDPVRAKTEGRDPEGVSPEVADLFPREFEDTELGAIPKEWKVSSFEDHLDVVRGLSYKGSGLTSSDDSEGVPMHNLNSVLEGGGYKYAGLKFYKGDFKPKHEIKSGDIIVANTEQGHKHLLIGFPAVVPITQRHPGLFSHHLYRVRTFPDSPLGQLFLFRLLLVPAVREQVIGCSNGTTVNMLKADGLAMPRFVCPPRLLVEAFERVAGPIQARQEQNVLAAENLASLRDTLLPRLMSGKLRVGESQVEAL